MRAGYFYAGVADVAALTGDRAYVSAIDRLWDNVTGRKMHLTGGIGASPRGEAFGDDYELPNANAYLETCAAIANAMWNHRMFLLHGDSRYIDVLERVIYNGFLAGVSMSGDRFFYPNPLETDGKTKFNHGSNERAPWFGCSCCPVNDVRFIPGIANYIYAAREDELFVNLFVAGSARVKVAGREFTIIQKTDYPWDGRVNLAFGANGQNAGPGRFTLRLRIPGWARSQPVPSDLYRYDDGLRPEFAVRVNKERIKTDVVKGYVSITRDWRLTDTVTLEMEMPVRIVRSHPAVKDNQGRFALERGPLVYCAEGADNGGKVLDRKFPGKVRASAERTRDLLGGIVTVRLESPTNGERLTCIPYYAWCHRGPNEMRVWFPE